MAENRAFPATGAVVLVATAWVRSHFPLQHCEGLPAEPRCLGLAERWVLPPCWVWEGMSKQAGNPLGPSMFRGGAGDRLRTEGRYVTLFSFCRWSLAVSGGGSCRGSDLAGVGRSASFGSWPQAVSWAVSLPACSDCSKFAFLPSELGRAGPLTPLGLRSPFNSVTDFRNV